MRDLDYVILEPKIGFIRPMFYNIFKTQTVTITEVDKVDIENQIFIPQLPLVVGEEMVIECMIFSLRAYTKKAYDAYQRGLAKQKEAERLKTIEREVKFKIERADLAKQFWLDHKLPFKFSLEIKERLAGLSEKSSGNGCLKNTVIHIYLHEDYSNARFKRLKDDFLCSPVKSKHFGNWGGCLGEGQYDFDNEGNRGVPTCAACLEHMKKFHNAKKLEMTQD